MFRRFRPQPKKNGNVFTISVRVKSVQPVVAKNTRSRKSPRKRKISKRRKNLKN